MVFLTVAARRDLQTSDCPADKANTCETRRKRPMRWIVSQKHRTGNEFPASFFFYHFTFRPGSLQGKVAKGDSWSAGAGESCIYGPDTTDLHREITHSSNSALSHLSSWILLKSNVSSGQQVHVLTCLLWRNLVYFLLKWLD